VAETAPESAAPRDADRLGGVLTTALYEYFAGRPRFTLSAYGRDERYEVLDGDPDDDVLTFERTADGARFEVEFWVNVSAVARGTSRREPGSALPVAADAVLPGEVPLPFPEADHG
jgi:hypothetical protein